MKLRYFWLGVAFLVAGVVLVLGPRGRHFTQPPMEIFPDMNYQQKVKDQVPSGFFANGLGARLPVAGTIALEMPPVNDYWVTGKWDETHWGDGIPVHAGRDGGRPLQVDDANVARGRERYAIYCAMCHGASGDGKGITSQYGAAQAANYHTDRLRQDADGDIYNTIANGHGQMMGYGANISIDDRWRIVMYIRALQRSENAALSEATPEQQKELAGKKKKS